MDQLCIAGATLGALLQSCCTRHRPCVGLLFGHVETRVSTHAQDTADDVLTLSQVIGHITSTCACVGTHTFYDSTGDISEEALAVILSSCGASGFGSSSSSNSGRRLLGWFSFRPFGPATPSMLEAAVSQKLANLLSTSSSSSDNKSTQLQPLVFGLVTSQMEHNGATLSLQHCFYCHHADSSWQPHQGQQQGAVGSSSYGGSSSSTGGNRSRQSVPQHPNLQPLELHVLNLGQLDLHNKPGGTTAATAAAGGSNAAAAGWSSSNNLGRGSTAVGGTGAGQQYSGQAMQLCALAAALEGGSNGSSSSSSKSSGSSSSKSPSASSMQQQLLAAAAKADAPGGQLAVVQGMYKGLLQELEAAAGAVSLQQEQLSMLQEENERLREEVAALNSSSTGGGGSRHHTRVHDVL